MPRDLGFPDLGRLGVGSRPGLFGPKARWSGVSWSGLFGLFVIVSVWALGLFIKLLRQEKKSF